MNKICTSIEQSKQLIKLGIDISTADMFWRYFKKDSRKRYYVGTMDDDDFNEKSDDVPAWSLSALLGILPYPSLHSTFMGWRCDSYNKEGTSCIFGEDADNPVDTCYEMILKLNEVKLL